MEIRLERVDRALVARLAGELDLHTAAAFREAVRRAFGERPGLRHLVLVLREVTFMDSSGVGALLGRYREAQSRAGRMVVVEPNASVRRVLELSGILRLVESAPSERRALQAL